MGASRDIDDGSIEDRMFSFVFFFLLIYFQFFFV